MPKVPAAVAIIAALSSMIVPSQSSGTLEWCADTGAGRHLTSFEALSSQGFQYDVVSSFANDSSENLKFSTGGGEKASSQTVGLRDSSGFLSDANHFLLESCPLVRSIGLDVEQGGFGFVWMPNSLPYFVRDPSKCNIMCDESNKFYASRVSQNVPFFKNQFTVIPGVPAAVDPGDIEVVTPPDLVEEPAVSAVEPDVDVGDRSSVAAEVREIAPDVPLPKLPESTVQARAEAVSIEHRISHFPKHPLCDICNRDKLFSKRIRSHRVEDPESDLPDPSSFGEQVAIDHMIVSKSSGGREFVVLIVYDTFSGILNAYPASSKSSDFVYTSLKHFVGLRYQNPGTICRSDAAPELVKAIRDLGWLPETSLPRHWPHNSKCERAIRSFEECCRCLHLQAGFAIMPRLWSTTCRYAAVAMSIDKWDTAFGSSFPGANYALGQLVFYRTKSQYKPKLEPNAQPALMAGWKLDFGLRYKGVLIVLDYEALREGKIVIVPAPDREVYTRDNVVFPLAEVAERALDRFSDPSIVDLDPQSPLPIPFVEDSPEMKEKSRRVYITFGRIQKLGATPGCCACPAFTPNHTPECAARHEEAFGSKTPGPEPNAPSDELERLLDEKLPPGLDFEYEASIASHDPLDDDEVPECPPPSDHNDLYEAESQINTSPHQALHEFDTDDEANDKSPVSGLSAVAGIACDAATIMPQEHVQEIFQDVVNQGGQTGCLGATANPEKRPPKHGKGKHSCPGKDVLFEFACAKDSNLGKVGHENGLRVIRLCKEDINLEDPNSIEQLIAQVDALKGCSIHGSIECKPWSQWQHFNRAKYLRLSKRIDQEQVESAALVEQFIRVANVCLDNGGDCSFEWPRYCTGWALPSIQSWILDRNLHSATFNGCTVGFQADGQPAKKPWRFLTSLMRLAKNLASLKCTHSTHAPLQGKWTRLSAFYPEPLCNILIQSLFPHIINQHVWSMPCVTRVQQPHRKKLVAGYPSVPLDIAMSNVGCKELVTPAYVHRLLDRSEWKDRPEVLEAINSEKQGLLANGTWDESKIRPKAEVLAEARAKGQTIHVGALMVIVSKKGYEKSPAEWSIKACIVFRGDAVRDEENQAAVFDELAASAPTSLGGLNLVIAFGLLDGHTCSTSDCIKAYVQSFLDSSCPTYVLLPAELVPDYARHMYQPVAPLVRSLYGHPLASASWQNHLSNILSTHLGGYELEEQPSCFHFPALNLALSVYVDDLTLSGPKKNHSQFWSTLRKHVQLEDPAELSKVLGRNHVPQDQGGLALHSADFAKQCVELYEQLSGKKAKHFRTPHCDSGTLVESDDGCVGQLSASSARLVMKLMWLGRISRPDILVAINTLARHITKWSANDDKRAARLVGYIAATIDHAHVMRINDPPAELWLSLYVDSDFGSSPDMKSTGGFIIALQGPNSFAVILWGSKTQRAVSRSTTEAEFVALSTALFGDAISLLSVCQKLIASTLVLKVYEDNQAVLAIIAKGYSPKLKHLAKFHRINVASTCEAFSVEDILIEYVSTSHQKEDVMNKALPVSVWPHVLGLLSIKSVPVI